MDRGQAIGVGPKKKSLVSFFYMLVIVLLTSVYRCPPTLAPAGCVKTLKQKAESQLFNLSQSFTSNAVLWSGAKPIKRRLTAEINIFIEAVNIQSLLYLLCCRNKPNYYRP